MQFEAPKSRPFISISTIHVLETSCQNITLRGGAPCSCREVVQNTTLILAMAVFSHGPPSPPCLLSHPYRYFQKLSGCMLVPPLLSCASSHSSIFPISSRRLKEEERVQQLGGATRPLLRYGRDRRTVSVRGGMLEEVANMKITTRDGREMLAFVAKPQVDKKLPVVILVHEFYGLTPEICGHVPPLASLFSRKADAIAKEVGCMVIAPDTYRGESTRFIPKAIFLALTTPQERVNIDLDEVIAWAATTPGVDISRVGLVGFCYGGGKILAYSTVYKKAKATVVLYGKPILESDVLQNIKGRVLGIFGDQDAQFPKKMVMGFQEALDKAGVTNVVSIYEGQGHAFWSNMDQIRQESPQKKAWTEVTSFLKDTLLP